MPSLSNQFRSHNSPSPIYGIRPGFNVGDLEGTQSTSVPGGSNGTPTFTANGQNSTPIASGARVVKLSVVVSSVSATDHGDLLVKSAVDNYTATIASYQNLTPGDYSFYLGGWSSPSGDSVNGTYQATKYGPPANKTADSTNPSYDQDIDDPDLSAGSNYVGQTFNPALFLSLDGYPIQVYSANFSGSPSIQVIVTAVS